MQAFMTINWDIFYKCHLHLASDLDGPQFVLY